MPSSRFYDPDSCISATASGTAGTRFLSGLAASIATARERRDVWHVDLLARGVVLAHPDDGWVDRTEHSVGFCYPSLRAREPHVGALVALGTPEKWRLVRITNCIPSVFGIEHARWAFEEVPDAE